MAQLALHSCGGASLPIPGADPWYAAPGDPALTVMTDFRERSSVTVAEDATVDAALEHMRHTGVRCAFAVDQAKRSVVGMITAYDIMSEKPLRHARSTESPRHEVRVKDIMLPLAEWRVVDVRELAGATVGEVMRLFDESQLTHLAVTESAADGQRRLRGLLSAAKVRRLLSR